MDQTKKWILKDYDKQTADVIADALSLSPVTAALLAQRGCTDKNSALSFINKENTAMHDPYLFKDMDKAVLRIVKAVQNGEKVKVYGDYDVDGITGTSVLMMFFRSVGVDVSYHIPERLTEGYGVNAEAIRSFAEESVDLIVTVDTGITAVEETELARSLGMDVIITDHHECRSDLPDAVAVIDPKIPGCGYPYKELAGVGVAFKLICAYHCYMATGQTVYDPEDREIIFDALHDCYKRYGDIVALGTIADVMPVTGENRLIIAYGLNKMKKTKNRGLYALLKATELIAENDSKKITSTSVGFILAPRINAAGRLGSAAVAAELFLTQSDTEAERLADWLCEKNAERQQIESVILAEAEEMISSIDLESERIIVLASDTWHHGVIGIVASRITEKYHLPSILISFDGSENDGKGSGRSINGFDLLAAITSCSELLDKYGGHTHAAGLSLKRENYDKFKQRVCEYAKNNITDEMTVRQTEVDAELTVSDISVELVRELQQLEPFGEGNPSPLFMIRDVKVTELIPLKEGKHTRICFSSENRLLQALYFKMQTDRMEYLPGDTVDMLFNLSENEFRGTVSAQMLVRDMKYCDTFYSVYGDEVNVYEYIKDDIILPQADHVPSRNDCAAVFRAVTKCGDTVNIHKLLKTVLKNENYVKLRLIFDVFTELGILQIKTADGIHFTVKTVPTAEKRALTTSALYNKLNSVEH